MGYGPCIEAAQLTTHFWPDWPCAESPTLAHAVKIKIPSNDNKRIILLHGFLNSKFVGLMVWWMIGQNIATHKV